MKIILIIVVLVALYFVSKRMLAKPSGMGRTEAAKRINRARDTMLKP